ncbi:hypothetical protein TRFO_32011 [Tritrichomonas foetus]|uniref:Ubiquitin-like domain-containing protein n=1 Tax=Tritrichomonas foetus TaxID=1144522 RepID=A0A1J4JQA1_9EUKA|nr:hypothetical protein TRFO_32011 [Tritrichomonas foetus]|eukprot:OHT01227.1 hypothetical protein TRFO_32011 [Tritrichomonas foetus]
MESSNFNSMLHLKLISGNGATQEVNVKCFDTIEILHNFFTNDEKSYIFLYDNQILSKYMTFSYYNILSQSAIICIEIISQIPKLECNKEKITSVTLCFTDDIPKSIIGSLYSKLFCELNPELYNQISKLKDLRNSKIEMKKKFGRKYFESMNNGFYSSLHKFDISLVLTSSDSPSSESLPVLW